MRDAKDVVYYGSVDGLSLEHVVRNYAHNMDVRHFHDEYEIFYILKGRRLFFFNNRAFLAQAGDLILIESDLIHMTRVPEEGEPGYERIIFYVTSEKMRRLDQQYPDLRFTRYLHTRTGVYRLTDSQREQFLEVCGLFRRECQKREYGYSYLIDFAFISLLIRLIRELPAGRAMQPLMPDEPKHRRAYDIADYLSQNSASVGSLDELAARFYISKFHMCHIFKEVTGYTVLEYLTLLRIRSARQYLDQTNLSASQIAERVGYHSLTHFEKEFKRYMTISPTQYRKTRNIVVPFDVASDFPQKG